MNVLVISAHPSNESFVGTLRSAVLEELVQKNHEIRHHDLYAEEFNPVFSSFERMNHVGNIEAKLQNLPDLRTHVEDIQWAEALVLVYPTWWSGQPAILKGWIDRVLMNEVAWVLPEGVNRIRPLLTNIRKIVVVTTHGSTKFVNALEGESGKRTAFRSIRLMFNKRTRCHWIGLYALDHIPHEKRDALVTTVRRRIRRALPAA
jgi:putative NADPH-quinone reductase